MQIESCRFKFSEFIPCVGPYRLEVAQVGEGKDIIHGYCMVPRQFKRYFHNCYHS